jgi:hypothetical protein
LILCLISFTLPAQTNLNASPQKLVTAGYAAKSDGVVEIGMVELTGRKINKADSLTKCQGDCEITIHDIIVKADELDFHPDTGEAEAPRECQSKNNATWRSRTIKAWRMHLAKEGADTSSHTIIYGGFPGYDLFGPDEKLCRR